MKKRLAVLPGDGIGKEVMAEAIKVLNMINEHESITITFDEFNWDSEYYLQHNRMLPADGLDQLKNYDAILFGAVGDSRVPEYIPIWDLIMPIRKELQQYVNFRPVQRLKGLETPLKLHEEQPIDFAIIRENAEGEYSNIGGSMFDGEDRELAVQNTVMTRQGIRDIAAFAFQYARKHHYTKITSATKSNAIIHVMRFWDRIVEEVAEQNSDMTYEKYYIDALAARFVQRPQDFQVVLASNLFGDILSDLGSAIVGGLGIAPSANINPAGDYPSMFEPVHGSAPDIAGKGIANPIAQIWSLALMLEHLGRTDLHHKILAAIKELVAERDMVTPDIGGSATTQQVGDAITEKLYN